MPRHPDDIPGGLEPTEPSTEQDALDEERATDEGMPDRVVHVPDPGHLVKVDEEGSTSGPDSAR